VCILYFYTENWSDSCHHSSDLCRRIMPNLTKIRWFSDFFDDMFYDSIMISLISSAYRNVLLVCNCNEK